MVEPVQHWWVYDFWNGGNPIEDWYQNQLGATERLAMDAMLKDVVKIKNHLEWGARDLEGAPKKEGVLELKFIAGKKAYRLAFIFQPGHAVVLLVGFYHKQNVYNPPNALKTARKRAKDFREKRATKVKRQINLDF